MANGRKNGKGIERNGNRSSWKWELTDKKFDHIEESLNKVIGGVDKVTISVETLTKLAEKHDAILFGKAEDLGETGLLMKVKNVDNKVKTLKADINRDTKWIVGIATTVWSFVLFLVSLIWRK